MPTTIVDVHKVNGKRPDFDIYIGRAVRYTEFTKNSKWYNPFYAKDYDRKNMDQCLTDFENYMRNKLDYEPEKYNLQELVGRKLGCWCITTSEIYPLRCHGQILLKLIRERGLE